MIKKRSLLFFFVALIALSLVAHPATASVRETTAASTQVSTARSTTASTALATASASTDSTACKLPEVANRGDVGLGFPRYASRMASTGTVPAVVLFVDFSDMIAKQTPAQVFSILSPGAPDFYKAVSYGRMDFQLQPYLKWLRMGKPSTAYSDAFSTYDGQRAYMQEALDLVGTAVDFSKAQAVYVIANPQVKVPTFGPAFSGAPEFGGVTAGNKTLYNGATSGADLTYWGFLWMNHEVAHTMGLVDLYAFQGDAHRFVGDFGIMGLISGKAPEYFAYERWLLGWLDDNQIVCQKTNNLTTVLTPIETKDGTKAVIVPTGPTSAVIVESRRALGYDSKLPKSGALVYTIDTAVASGAGPIQVVPNKDPQRYLSPLALGTSVTVGKVTVKVIKTTSTSDTVQVTIAK